MSELYEDLEAKVTQWAKDRKIIPNAKPHTQLLKAFSEMGELADAENKLDMPGIKDGVGDVLVCLINYCALRNVSMVDCLALAYHEIKDRTGTLREDGVFVKDVIGPSV